jgi:hypothetical protein
MRAIHFLYEEQQLDEVAMNPNALRTMASKVGATAGMEFEMIIPEMENPDDDTDYENDFDSDDRASSFNGIEDFFMGGDGNNSRVEVRSMIEAMRESFWEWASEYQANDWSNSGKEYLKDYIELNDDFDFDQAREVAIDELRDNYPEIEEDSDEWNQYIEERIEKELEAFIDDEWQSNGRIYDRAYESFVDDYEYPDEGDWLDSYHFKYMSDVYNEFGSDHSVYWPYTRPVGGSGEGELNDLAVDFSDAIGRGVNASTSYHGVRKDNEYTIEPDGSLNPDSDDDAGLEFVSPPLPLDEMIQDLQKTVAWAKNRSCYTNESTGLHMNVSVPGYSLNKLDYVKLALLMGDEYVLNDFGRIANSYAKSAMGKIREQLPSDPKQVQVLLQQMKNGLAKEASKAIHSGQTDKYTSINTKTGYIEFRSPGGNWLDEDLPKLINTLYRFVVALDAACDPEKYRKDYLKKLYAVLQPKSEGDTIAYFAQYAAGTLSKEQLSALIKTMRGTATGSYWWNVAVDMQRIEVVASNKEEAWQKATESNPEWRRYNINQADIKPIKPFVDNRPEQSSIQGVAGAPQPVGQQTKSTEQAYEIYTTLTNQANTRFTAGNDKEAMQMLSMWRDGHPGVNYGVRRAR